MGKYFGTDGVRGVANEDLTLDMAVRIGQYLGWYYGQQRNHARILIGKDTRLSGDMFELGLAAGAVSTRRGEASGRLSDSGSFLSGQQVGF